MGLSVCNTLLAVTVFLVVKFHGYFERNIKIFFWIYLACATILPLSVSVLLIIIIIIICFYFLIEYLVGLLAAFSYGSKIDKGVSCSISPEYQFLFTYPFFGLWAIQVPYYFVYFPIFTIIIIIIS